METKEAPARHIGTIYVGGAGATQWDTSDPASIEQARARFDTAIRAGYLGQAYGSKVQATGMGYSGVATREFEPEADEIRMSLPYAGG